ncbi:MAG: hypothetical protein HUU50_07340 [Candidatus Brocadiae bacterium]|nr:hypothetical protein [Candidatus Brocadiia bacterium]
MSAILAIAFKVLQEAKKTKPALLLFFFVIFLLFLFPFTLKSDGTLNGQIQLFIGYSLLILSLALYSNSIFFSVLSFTSEIKGKQFYLIDCKSISRWQFFVGKFLGMAILNFFALVFMGLILLFLILYIKETQGTAEERADVQEKIFTSYQGIEPHTSMEKLFSMVDKEYQKRKAENRLPSNMSEEEIKSQIKSQIQQQLQVIPYGYQRIWHFHNLPSGLKSSQQKIKLRYKIFLSDAGSSFLCKVYWQAGKGTNLYAVEDKVKAGEYYEFTFPSDTVEENNTLEVHFFHKDEKAGMIYFPIEKGIELFYPYGSFYGNYIKTLLLVYLLSCFLVALSLFASTFLTFPIAVFLGLFILFLGLIAPFLMEISSLGQGIENSEKEILWERIPDILSYAILQASFFIIPDFFYYAPLESLALGRYMTWSIVGESILKLILLRATLFSILGCFLFKHREVGKPLL